MSQNSYKCSVVYLQILGKQPYTEFLIHPRQREVLGLLLFESSWSGLQRA